MAKTRDWTEILVRRSVIGPDQLKEAQRMDSSAIEEALVKLGYAGADDIMKAKAEQHGLPFVELREIEIPPSVIELVPESLARENIVMPLSQESGSIRVIMHNPLDFETIDKLRFVLNREIEVSLAPKEAIVEAINKYYGSATSETESVDSMLQEFTDTAIDFAEDGRGRYQVGYHQHVGRGRCAGHQAGAPDHSGSRHAAGERHSHRAVCGPGADSLPD